jgi:hypothetical protein
LIQKSRLTVGKITTREAEGKERRSGRQHFAILLAMAPKVAILKL